MEEREAEGGRRKRTEGLIFSEGKVEGVRGRLMGRLLSKAKLSCRLFPVVSPSLVIWAVPTPPTSPTPPTTHHMCGRSGPDWRGRGRWTSSDLANKHSINGAVERVTHASQNLLRSNSPLQFPLHWADPQAAGPKHRPGHRPPRCQVTWPSSRCFSGKTLLMSPSG